MFGINNAIFAIGLYKLAEEPSHSLVTAPENHILQNNYNLLKDNLSDIDIAAFEGILKTEITNQLKSNKVTEFFRKNNTTLVYKYFDKKKQYVTDIVILPSDYR